jgi:hypothetical protein
MCPAASSLSGLFAAVCRAAPPRSRYYPSNPTRRSFSTFRTSTLGSCLHYSRSARPVPAADCRAASGHSSAASLKDHNAPLCKRWLAQTSTAQMSSISSTL